MCATRQEQSSAGSTGFTSGDERDADRLRRWIEDLRRQHAEQSAEQYAARRRALSERVRTAGEGLDPPLREDEVEIMIAKTVPPDRPVCGRARQRTRGVYALPDPKWRGGILFQAVNDQFEVVAEVRAMDDLDLQVAAYRAAERILDACPPRPLKLHRGVYELPPDGRDLVCLIAVDSLGREIARERIRDLLYRDQEEQLGEDPVFEQEYDRVVRVLWQELDRRDPMPADPHHGQVFGYPGLVEGNHPRA